jgi:phosphoribosylformylglycinamidine cyclo-ligase
MPDDLKIIKDGLPEQPAIFKLLQQNSGASDREMMEVFNMGIRLEIYCPEHAADKIIAISNSFGIGAHRIGRVESSVKKTLEILWNDQRIVY